MSTLATVLLIAGVWAMVAAAQTPHAGVRVALALAAGMSLGIYVNVQAALP